MVTKFNLNYFFLIACGFQLGGNIKRCYLRNSSVVYAKKKSNFIVKVSLTSLQFKKSIRLMARYIRKKSTLYFVHSHFGFKLLMQQLFDKTNMFYLKVKRKALSIFKQVETVKIPQIVVRQLKKLYFLSYWRPGFLTNRVNFFKTRINKKIKIKLPKFGFLNDYKVNLISLKEFKFSHISYSSLVNLNVSSTIHGLFDIPGNGVSYDTCFLTLIL